MSKDVYMEIDWDDRTVIIVPEAGGIYQYSLDEVDNDVIDRIIEGGAEYTVYSQGESYTKEEYEEIINWMMTKEQEEDKT